MRTGTNWREPFQTTPSWRPSREQFTENHRVFPEPVEKRHQAFSSNQFHFAWSVVDNVRLALIQQFQTLSFAILGKDRGQCPKGTRQEKTRD
jgi:hypothetical protein